MAETRPPRQARAIIAKGGQATVMHPQHGSIPSAPKMGGGMGGGAAGGGGGGSGLTKAFPGGGQGGDPAVSGNFERMPTTTFLHFPIAGGGLTERGKADKADNDILRQGTAAYASAVYAGATPQEAATAAVKAGGGAPFLAALMTHPSSPLASVGAFHNFMSGSAGTPGPVFGGVDKNGNQVKFDPSTGEALGTSHVPGFPDAQPGFDTKRMVKTDKGLGYVQDDGTIKPMNWANGNPIPNGGGVITSAGGGPNGQVGLPPSAAQQKAADAANQPVTPYSKDPLPSPSSKHPLTNAQVSYLSNAPNFINDLKIARDYADTSGPVSGMVNYVGGKYIGTNAEGAVSAAALNRLDQGVYAQYGVKGSAGAKQLMKTLPTHNEAPSYVRSSITGMIENATGELQSQADIIEKQSGPLPGTVTSQLENKVDVFPLSDQHNASPSWVARNYPTQLTGPMATTLSHRTDLEPSEVKGLDARLDAVSAQRAQDAQTAAQAGAAKAADVQNRPSSMTPPMTPPTPETGNSAPGEQPVAQPQTQTPATGSPPAGPNAAPPTPTPQPAPGEGQTQEGQTIPLPPPMPNSSATPSATPAPPAAPAPAPVAPQSQDVPAVPAPGQPPAMNPYTAAMLQGGGT